MVENKKVEKIDEKIENQKVKKKKETTNNLNLGKQNKSNFIKNKEDMQENKKIELDSTTLRPKDYHKLREEMLKKFNESKLKD